MLYSHAGDVAPSNAGEGYRDEWGGLGAVSPHVANLRTTTGGGYGVTSVGGGAGPGDNSGQAVPGFGGASYRGSGRFTSMVSRKGARIGLYQHSGQGARVSMETSAVPTAAKGSAGSRVGFPTGGLFGVVAEHVKPHTLGAIDEEPGYDTGLGDFFGWLGARFTPPGGRINRIQIIPKNIRNQIPDPIRKAVRYGGAGVAAVFAPILTGSQQRKIFGLDPNESAVFMKTQQVSRGIIAAIAAVAGGAAGYSAYSGSGAAASSPGVLGGGAPYAPGLFPAGSAGWQAPTIAELASSPIEGSVLAGGAPLAAPSTVGIFGGGAPLAPGLTPAGSVGWQAPTAAQLSATPASGSVLGGGAPLTAAKEGLLLSAGKNIGSAALNVATLGVLSKILSPGMPGGGGDNTPQGGTSVQVGGGQPGSSGGTSGDSGGGGSAGASEAPILAGSTLPMMIAVAGIIVTIGVTYFRKKK